MPKASKQKRHLSSVRPHSRVSIKLATETCEVCGDKHVSCKRHCGGAMTCEGCKVSCLKLAKYLFELLKCFEIYYMGSKFRNT